MVLPVPWNYPYYFYEVTGLAGRVRHILNLHPLRVGRARCHFVAEISRLARATGCRIGYLGRIEDLVKLSPPGLALGFRHSFESRVSIEQMLSGRCQRLWVFSIQEHE